MTSAFNHPTIAAAASEATAIDAVAERIATDWGHHSHTGLTTMIIELYTDLAALPAHWTAQQRTEILTEIADITTSELMALLDDYIYLDADRSPVTEFGAALHTDDRRHALTAMLAALAVDHLTGWLTDRIPESITEHDSAGG